jgi:hypothetical protein
MDLPQNTAWASLMIAGLCSGAYVYGYVLKRYAPRIADVVSLAATILALVLLAFELLSGSVDALRVAVSCGLLAVATIAQAAGALRTRRRRRSIPVVHERRAAKQA